ncbi:hypothetical protein ACFW6V_28445 [Streptomyces sp. NPDC058734]|uniref:hypothetical protein n=1 Tax=Streptomyces sp. NPDC058734 TaxID=3346615 RepID=UPI0036BB9310
MSGTVGRRGRWVTFTPEAPSEDELALVSRLGPYVFRVTLDGSEVEYDLSDCPCPQLARTLALALADLGDSGAIGAKAAFDRVVGAVRAFLVHAAENTSPGDGDSRLLTASRLPVALVDGFEEALIARHGEESYTAYDVFRNLMRLLRSLDEGRPEVFGPEMKNRVRFNARRLRPAPATPLDAYPPETFAAIEARAEQDVRAVLQRITAGERLAAQGADPEVAGWDKEENVLWHVMHCGPLTRAHTREPRYWMVRKMGWAFAVNERVLLTHRDMVPFVVLLICRTGMEPECVTSLRADCLVNEAREFVSVRYVKRRAHHEVVKTLRVGDGGSVKQPGGIIRLATRLTATGRRLAGSDRLFVTLAVGGGLIADTSSGQLSNPIRLWMARTGLDRLQDVDGRPVRMDLRRLRKSVKSRHYLRSGGFLPDFTQGHTREVAARHYAGIEAHREVHELAIEDALADAAAVALAPPTVLDEAGRRLDNGPTVLTEPEVTAVRGGESDVFLASCRDFHATPWAPPGTACPVSFWGCLECPNAVFTLRHLPSILGFLDFIERQRDELPEPAWQARYGVAWQRIVEGIRPKFTDAQITEAAAIAEAAGDRLALPTAFLTTLATP